MRLVKEARHIRTLNVGQENDRYQANAGNVSEDDLDQ